MSYEAPKRRNHRIAGAAVGLPAPPLAARALAVSALLTAALFLTAAPASAATSHVFTNVFGSKTSTPADPYPLSEPTEVAVDNSAGPSAHDVYVTDPGNHRVEKFSPSGHFLLMFGKEVNKTALERAGSTAAEQNVCAGEPGEECQAGAPGSSPGAFQTPTYVAVDESSGPSAGDVYVSDPGNHLVQKFDSSGHIVSSWPQDGQKNGADTGNVANFTFLGGIAVGVTGNLYVLTLSNEGQFQNCPCTAYEYEQTGVHLATLNMSLDSEQKPYLAVDSAGDLYFDSNGADIFRIGPAGTSELRGVMNSVFAVTGYGFDIAGNELYQDTGESIDRYSAECNPVGFIGTPCNPIDSFGSGDLSAPNGVAIDEASRDVYVANSGSNDVALFDYVQPQAVTGPISQGSNTSVTVTGHVDLAGHGAITKCEFEYGRERSYGSTVPCDQAIPYSGPMEVSATITGLPVGFHGHYRLSISNAEGGTAEGADEPFTTLEPPSIQGLEAVNVTATSAELTARINPDDATTTYRFEYGTSTAYGQQAPVSETPIETELGREHAVQVQLVGLTPNLVYHYRLIAENVQGTIGSGDQTFSFYPPSCPNATVRQQTGSNSLPDCRAYELVTPASSGSALIIPAGATPNSGLASNPSRLAYGTWGGTIPGAGNPINNVGDMYVATRTDQGWVSKYIGLPGNQSYLTGRPPWTATETAYTPSLWSRGVLANPSLSTVVDWNDGQYETSGYSGEGEGVGSSNAPYVWDSTTGSLIGRWPTSLGEVEGGESFKGRTVASADLSHFVFSSNLHFPVEEKELPAAVKGAIYDHNVHTGQTVVVSVDAAGKNIKAAPDATSADGSHILLSTPIPTCTESRQICPPAQLYMRVNDAVTYEIAPGHLVDYVGMTADGSKLYFTSGEELTSEDRDTSVDLYLWNGEKAENGEDPLTLISKGESATAGAPGNTDNCEPASYQVTNRFGQLEEEEVPWTSKCDVKTIAFNAYSSLQGGLGGNGATDSAIASEGGDIYFYSPEQLVGDKGISGQENLYLYRGGALQFVASLTPQPVCSSDALDGALCSEGSIARMNVSPTGSHMAFVTASQVTSYDNTDPSGGCELNDERNARVGSPRCTEMYSYLPSTGKISCDSCPPSGAPSTSGVFASQNGLFMASDGRTFFSTENPLAPSDTDQASDVYEFVEGQPRLISGGTTASVIGLGSGIGYIGQQTLPGLVAVSANGTDVYFATSEVLVRQDENGEEIKIYDARTDGGFPAAPPPAACAAADECHGPGSSPPAPISLGSAARHGRGGNLASERHAAHHKKQRHHRNKKKRHHRKLGGGRSQRRQTGHLSHSLEGSK